MTPDQVFIGGGPNLGLLGEEQQALFEKHGLTPRQSVFFCAMTLAWLYTLHPDDFKRAIQSPVPP